MIEDHSTFASYDETVYFKFNVEADTKKSYAFLKSTDWVRNDQIEMTGMLLYLTSRKRRKRSESLFGIKMEHFGVLTMQTPSSGIS